MTMTKIAIKIIATAVDQENFSVKKFRKTNFQIVSIL